MTGDPSSPTGSAEHHPTDQRKAELLGECLDRLNAGETVDLERIAREHPDLAPELSRQLEAFRALIPDDARTADASGGDQALGVLGDYRLRRKVGRGGMGVVYEAWQNSMDRRVALKVLPSGIAADSKTVTRFVREARVAGQLHHPHVVSVFGMGIEQNTPYYAMEFVEGETLAQVLTRLKEAPLEEKTPFGYPRDDVAYYSALARAFADVADGLQHAHSKGVTHRDIKPSNLILDREGRLRILDFGLAHLEGQESLTLTGDILGTPLYMSPEQAMARRIPIDHRTDIYSLGATLYEMVAWKPPFEGKNHQDTLSQIIFREPPPLRARNPRIAKDLETIVDKCLRKDPADRYGTAEALAQDLRRFARGDAIEARPESVLGRLSRKASRNKGRLTVAAVLAILLAATGILLWRSHQEAEARKAEAYESMVRAAVVKMQVRQPALQVAPVNTPFLIDWKDFQMVGGGGPGDPVQQAVAELVAAAGLIPARPDAHFQRARALIILGREAQAKGALERARSADPAFAPARVLLSSLLEKAGDRDGALREMQEIEGRGQAGWARAWLSAHRAAEDRRWAEADVAYGKLLEMEHSAREAYLGSSIDLHIARGIARLEIKDFPGAIEDFVAARLLSPRSPEPGLLLGKAYFQKGEEDQAERTFEEVLEEARREPLAADKVCLGVTAMYNHYHRWANALPWVEKVSDEGLRERIRARILFWLGRDLEAKEAALKSIRVNPRDARAYAILASLCFYDKPAEAEKIVRQGLDIDPQDFRLHMVLAGALESMAKLDAALEEYRKAIDLGSSYFNGLGRLYLEKGDLQKAFEAYRKGIEAVPEDTFSHGGFADALFTQDRFQEALAEYRKVLEIDPGHGTSTLDNLRSILSRKVETDLGPELERLLDLLEKLFSERRRLPRDLSGVFQAGISALLARRAGDNSEQALRRSGRAAEMTGRKQPEVLAALAEAQFENGLLTETVLTLEEALSLPHAGRSLSEKLIVYRKALLPDLASYASIDAAISSPDVEDIIPEGATWKFFRGTEEPSPGFEWTQPSFEDGSWGHGRSSFGFGYPRQETLLPDMQGHYTSLYLRHEFPAPDPSRFQRLVISVKADDGCVAYLNGNEIGRARVGNPGMRVAFNGVADDRAAEPLQPTEIPVEMKDLLPGKNLLAVEGLNVEIGNHDFYLLPVLYGERVAVPERNRKLLESFRAVAKGQTADSRIAYYEARLLEEAGSLAEAAEKFQRLAARGDRRPEPLLHAAECLRRAGRGREAEDEIRKALDAPALSASEDIWRLWAMIGFVDLHRPPAEMLAGLPVEVHGYGADVRWLLAQLAAGGGIRINCGGEEYRGPKGEAWGRDRFFRSGYANFENLDRTDHYSGEIRGTERAALYQTARWFPEGEFARAGYSIPLPPGTYRVALHFAETVWTEPRKRVFDVLMEGKEVLPGYEPLTRGSVTADSKTFDIPVTDGCLEIEFRARKDNPQTAAIEIERIE
jgi:serine/threonine protein kinase/tetratricopeptide (TPR) repeat protein